VIFAVHFEMNAIVSIALFCHVATGGGGSCSSSRSGSSSSSFNWHVLLYDAGDIDDSSTISLQLLLF